MFRVNSLVEILKGRAVLLIILRQFLLKPDNYVVFI